MSERPAPKRQFSLASLFGVVLVASVYLGAWRIAEPSTQHAFAGILVLMLLTIGTFYRLNRPYKFK